MVRTAITADTNAKQKFPKSLSCLTFRYCYRLKEIYQLGVSPFQVKNNYFRSVVWFYFLLLYSQLVVSFIIHHHNYHHSSYGYVYSEVSLRSWARDQLPLCLAPMSESPWMIFQFTQWYFQDIFPTASSLGCSSHLKDDSGMICGRLWRTNTIAIFASRERLWCILMGYFLASFPIRSTPGRCHGRFGRISFPIFWFFAGIRFLMHKIYVQKYGEGTQQDENCAMLMKVLMSNFLKKLLLFF